MTQINNWVSTSITREDIAQNTRRVQLSYEQNSRVGLSREVLLMEQRAISAPLIPVHHNGNLDPVIIEKIKTLYNF
ncbi:hypothetical protein [Vibrio diazotrophicus]|jgi:hypothetical protein|uniref:hypothetical protein n=1 Tax=Vibrio diazotrophicus TaxID=685 RepID=UPI003D2F9AE8